MRDGYRKPGLAVLAGVAIAVMLIIGGAALLAITANLAAAPVSRFRIGQGEKSADSPIIVTTRNFWTPSPTASPTPTIIAWNEPTATAQLLVEAPPTPAAVRTAAIRTASVEQPIALQPTLPQTDDVALLPTPSSTPTTVPPVTASPQELQAVPLPSETAQATPETFAEPPAIPVETPAVPVEPSPVASITPLPERPVAWYNDIADLETFVRQHRGSIAGQQLDILSLTRTEPSPDAVARFTLEVNGSEASDVFAAQSAEDLLSYGQRLLDDVKRYQGGEACELVIKSSYEVTATGTCTDVPEWCTVDSGSTSAGIWSITRVYLQASYTAGVDSVTIWKAVP
jgi:hypothetical protein